MWFTPSRCDSAQKDHDVSEEDDFIFPGIEPEDMIEPSERRRYQREEIRPLMNEFGKKVKTQKKKRFSPSSSDSGDQVILAPQPIPFHGSIIPKLDQPRPDLPPPLHSQGSKPSHHESIRPVILAPELEWMEEDGLDNAEWDPSWGKAERIKGPEERAEEDMEDMSLGTSHSSLLPRTEDKVDINQWMFGLSMLRNQD